MTPFGYLSVLISIVLGLALTELLSRLQRLIQARERVRLNWLPLAWVGIIFVLVVQWWWASFGLRNQQTWNFFSFLLVLLTPTLLYLAASLVLPEADAGREQDLGRHYFGIHRLLFGIVATVNLLSFLQSLAASDVQAATLSFCGMVLSISLALVKSRGFHAVGTIGSGLLLVTFIVLETLQIG